MSHANGVAEWRTLATHGPIAAYGARRGTADLMHRVLGYADGINLTHIQDQLDPARNEAYSYGPANRLWGGEGPWGSVTYETNGSGNRLSRERISASGTIQHVYDYLPGSNRLAGFTQTGEAPRSYSHDGAGNVVATESNGLATVYTYNHAGQMSHVSIAGSVRGPYVYNGFASSLRGR
jgi:hypothetical protein